MPTFKPVKYVIFDMDGLLLATEKIYEDMFQELLGQYGATYTDEMKIRILGTVPKDRNEIFVKEYKLPHTPEQLSEELEAKTLVRMQQAELMPGAERLVRHLKKNNIPIAVATSSSKTTFNVKTKNHQELFSLFHHIVIGSSDPEVKNGKPAPDVFLVCASRFAEKPSPDECLVFEDAPNGVQGAAAAGMQVVMVPDPVIPGENRKLATKVIPSLLDFKPEEFGLPAFES